MTIINQNKVAVSTFTELKDTIENTTYTYIYLETNITLTNGIKIPSTKETLTIDGTYNGVKSTLTDQKKLGTNDTIYISSPNTTKVTVQNLDITGYNYYGIIYVPSSSSYQNTIIEYSNITYTGPQLSYHPQGLTRLLDCTITIQENYAPGNEIAECNKIEIGGFTIINHKSTSNSSFWFKNNNPSFTILKNATVHITSTSRELFYGTNNLTLTISKNALFYLTTNNGLAYGTFGTGTTLIDENATLQITQTAPNGNNATWYSYGTITLNQGSSLIIINNYPNIKTTNYNISFQGTNTSLILNNPEKVILYNDTANIFNTKNDTTFNFTYNRINLFTNPISILDNITKDTLPTYSWYKETNLSTISGTFNNTTTTITNNNYTKEELTNLPDLTNFNLSNKKILSIGIFPLTVSPITETDLNIHGITNAYNSILIEYNTTSTIVIADEYGNFTHTYTTTLPEGTKIKLTVKQYEEPIYYTKQVQVVYSGELTLESATKYFQFEPYAISTNPTLCPRLTELSIIVTDSRVNSTNWKLYATIYQDLTSPEGKTLKNSLVFIDDYDNITPLSNTPTLVYQGYANEGLTTKTLVDWSEDKGILLKIIDPLENNIEYTTKIIWTLEE